MVLLWNPCGFLLVIFREITFSWKSEFNNEQKSKIYWDDTNLVFAVHCRKTMNSNLEKNSGFKGKDDDFSVALFKANFRDSQVFVYINKLLIWNKRLCPSEDLLLSR